MPSKRLDVEPKAAMSSQYSKSPRGDWVASEGSRTIAVVNPATETVIAEVPAGTPGDADHR